MKITIIVLIVIIAAAVYFFYPIFKAFKVASQIEDRTTAFEQHSEYPKHPTMKILVAGDSTAVGTGASNKNESTAGRLGKQYPNADITNLSKNGLKLEGLHQLLKSFIIQSRSSKSYDLILLQIGANDVVGFTSLDTIKKELISVLDISAEHSTNIIILTAGNIGNSPVFKAPLSSVITKRTLVVRDIFMKEVGGRTHVQYVDLFKDAKDDIFLTDISKYYAEDLFHPSTDGYTVWYEEIKKFLK